MNTLAKEDFTVSISRDVVRSIRKHYRRDDYSLIVENYFKLMLPKTGKIKKTRLSGQLRGCAASSGLVNKTDKEIKEMMYKEKYKI